MTSHEQQVGSALHKLRIGGVGLLELCQFKHQLLVEQDRCWVPSPVGDEAGVKDVKTTPRAPPCSPTSAVLSVSLTAPSRSSSAMTSGLPVAAPRTASQGGGDRHRRRSRFEGSAPRRACAWLRRRHRPRCGRYARTDSRHSCCVRSRLRSRCSPPPARQPHGDAITGDLVIAGKRAAPDAAQFRELLRLASAAISP
jgi:hypothetical protein